MEAEVEGNVVRASGLLTHQATSGWRVHPTQIGRVPYRDDVVSVGRWGNEESET
jgi:hypothetical protein